VRYARAPLPSQQTLQLDLPRQLSAVIVIHLQQPKVDIRYRLFVLFNPVLTGNFPTVYILVQSLPIDLFITPY
jgi:hypothetical protein